MRLGDILLAFCLLAFRLLNESNESNVEDVCWISRHRLPLGNSCVGATG